MSNIHALPICHHDTEVIGARINLHCLILLHYLAHLGAVRKHDFPTIFSDVDRILNCAVKSPDQFRIAVSSCNGYHLLMDAFAKLSGSLSRSFVTDFGK